MKRIYQIGFMAILILSMVSHSYAQKDTIKTAKFVVVQMALWNTNTGRVLDKVSCTAQYSNGLIQDIDKALNLTPMDRGFDTNVFKEGSSSLSILNKDELMILSYFYDLGYELIMADSNIHRYYFKLKDTK